MSTEHLPTLEDTAAEASSQTAHQLILNFCDTCFKYSVTVATVDEGNWLTIITFVEIVDMIISLDIEK